MLSRRIRRFTIVALALGLWLASAAYRNRGTPQVRQLSWENGTLECELWNSQDQPVYVRTLMRLVYSGCEESGTQVQFSEEKEIYYHIAAKSHLKVKEQLPANIFGKPEVRVFLADSNEKR